MLTTASRAYVECLVLEQRISNKATRAKLWAHFFGQTTAGFVDDSKDGDSRATAGRVRTHARGIAMNEKILREMFALLDEEKKTRLLNGR